MSSWASPQRVKSEEECTCKRGVNKRVWDKEVKHTRSEAQIKANRWAQKAVELTVSITKWTGGVH